MNIRETKEYKDLYEFLIEKSNSAKIEPVFKTEGGQKHALSEKEMDLVNQILEDAYLPYITEVLLTEYFKVGEKQDEKRS